MTTQAKPTKERIVVAMSGGVDSAVAAALMVEEGYEVVGITLQLYNHGAAIAKKGACCAGQDIHDARRVADQLGIAHYILDYETRFRQAVIDDFAETYARGATPIPCVRCNQRVKFKDLVETAKDLGAASLITGHYAQIHAGIEGPELHAAFDANRDQSYFLFATPHGLLDYLRFPLGGMAKSETRRLAQRFALPVAAKPDSQDICFVPTGGYAAVIEKLRPDAARPGAIIDMAGNMLGHHNGIIHFTVGQRKGIGIASAAPLYVVALDAASATVTVGPRSALEVSEVLVDDCNFLAAIPAERPITVKLRSTQPAALATLSTENSQAKLILERPVEGVSPGQAAVFYAGSRVLGGGWIKATKQANSSLAISNNCQALAG